MQTIQTAHILLFQKNKVLLVQHGAEAGHITGTYGIPGGRLNDGEDLKTAAVRELQEETGLSVAVADLMPFPDNTFSADIKRKDGEMRSYTMTIFVTKHYTGDLQTSTETTPEWVSLDTIETLNLLPNVAKAIQNAQTYLKTL